MNFEEKVVYQVYIRSFLDTTGDGTGDINGVIDRLEYIKQLGADYIWLHTVCNSDKQVNDLGIIDYYKVEEKFGTTADFQELVKAANENELKIMIDLTINHTSKYHEWFQKAIAGDEKYLNYYIWASEPNDIKNVYGDSAWTYNESAGKYYFHITDDSQPELNWQNSEVRHEIYDIINYWKSLGVEGFKFDAIDLLAKDPVNNILSNGPRLDEFIEELNNYAIGGKIVTVGECYDLSLENCKRMSGKKGINHIFHLKHAFETYGVVRGIPNMDDIYETIESIKNWQNELGENQSIALNHNDMPRLISLWTNDVEYRYEAATLLATIFTLLRGTQYIYQGEEIGMTNSRTSEDNKFEENPEKSISPKVCARTPMQWTNGVNAGFSSGQPWLDINENYQEVNARQDLTSEKSVYHYYANLIAFKKENFDQSINYPLQSFELVDGILTYCKKNIKVVCNTKYRTVKYKSENKLLFNNYSNFESGKLMPLQAIVEELND